VKIKKFEKIAICEFLCIPKNSAGFLVRARAKKLFAPFFVKEFFENQNFCYSGIEPAGPTLLNLSDRKGGVLDHLTIAPEFFPIGGGNGL
jgi:hypothetical protein